MNGPSGVVTGVIMGLLRVIPMKGQNITDIVPADNTINALIGTMWDTVNRYCFIYFNIYNLQGT